MAEGTTNQENQIKSIYPLTKMNFLITVDQAQGATAAFSEVNGVEATVDVIEFRQGNSGSLAPVKIPGLVKHGNVTLKFGYTSDENFKKWVIECVSEKRAKGMPRSNVQIEMIDISDGAPQGLVDKTQSGKVWTLTNAWVTKYMAPDLNASTSEGAIETVELAYEELTIPN